MSLFPFHCTDWMNSVHLSSNHRSRKQVPKHLPFPCYRKAAESHASECPARTTTTKGHMISPATAEETFLPSTKKQTSVMDDPRKSSLSDRSPSAFSAGRSGCPPRYHLPRPPLHVFHHFPCVFSRRLTTACFLS